MDNQVNSQMRKQFGGFGKQLGGGFGKQLGAGLKASEAAVKAASRAHVDALDKIKDATGKLAAEEAKLDAARSTAASRAQAVGTAERRLKELRDTETATDKQLEAAERSVATARERARNAAAQATGISSRVEASRRREIAATREAADAEKELNEAKNRGNGRSGFLSGSGLGNRLEGVASQFSDAGKSSGLAFAAGAGAALLAGGLLEAGSKAAGLVADGFKSVVDAGVDFDKTFNNFQAVTGSSTAQMQAFRQEAIALGGDTQIAGANASDAATAMTELAKAGFSVDQAMAAARGTLQLSAAAQISAADAATIEGNALNTFGLNADQASHAADVLANVANASSGEMTDFAYGLQAGGAVAHQFGISIEDTAATMGVLANNGIKGSDAGTLLKSALLALASPSDQAGQALDELNVHAFDANGNFVGMREIFNQLHTASTRLTPEMYAMSTSTAFGSDAARLAGVAASKGAEGFDLMRTAVAKQGTAADVAAVQNQGLPGVIENIKNSIDTLKLGLYDIISGPLQNSLGGLSVSVNSHKPELIAFFTDIGLAAVSMAEFTVKSVGMVSEGIGELISPLTATIAALLHGVAEFERIGGFNELADKLDGAGNSLSGLSQGLVDFGEKAKNVSLSGLYNDIKTSGEQAENAAKFTRDLAGNLTLLPDKKTVVLSAPTEDVLAQIDKTKYSIEAIPGSKDFKVVAKTDEATTAVNAWIAQQVGKSAELSVGANMALANQDVKRWGDQLAVGGAINIPIRAVPTGGPLIGGGPAAIPPPPPRATGGIYDVWRSVASFAGGKLPDQAMIQPPVAGAGLVQWAEPSTHGEAFIPLAKSKRARSMQIWAETGRRLHSFEQGGMLAPDVAAARSLAGTPYSKGARNDCSGMAARVIARALGLPESGLMSTKNAAQWLAALGFRPGVGGPGQLSVGWYDHGPGQNDGHMAITLSDGSNAESGGSNNVFTIGAGAAGASSPEFDQHMFLPTLFGEGPGGSVSGSSLGGAGGMAGVGPNGEAGTYSAPSQKDVREADEKVADADARSREADLRVKELKADASESEKESAKNAADKAKREAADARADRDQVMKGKFTPGKGGAGGKGDGGGQFGELGSIAKSFLSDTLGLGDLFPDPSQLGVVQLAKAMMGIKYTPQGTGFRGGLLAGMPGAMEATSSDQGALSLGGDGGGGLPFGMLPGIASMLPTPGAPIGTPASGQGLGTPPGPVDQSTNVTIQNPQMDEASNAGLIRRTLLKTPRYGTYTQNPAVMGA